MKENIAEIKEILVTDIDNTIADTRPRLNLTLKEIGRGEVFEKSLGTYGGFKSYLSEKELEKFWSLFLSNNYLEADAPIEGSSEALTRIVLDNIPILYLTGRHHSKSMSMRQGTLDWLKENNFPLPTEDGVFLKMKPAFGMDDKSFKINFLKKETTSLKSGIGIGDLPDDVDVYARSGLMPILINAINNFKTEELRKKYQNVYIVNSWKQIEKKVQELF